MTTFFDLVARRQSDRAFDPNRPVEKEKIQRILETVRLTPVIFDSDVEILHRSGRSGDEE